MKLVTGLTSDPIQKFRINSHSSNPIGFKMRYNPAVQSWFIDINYKNKNCNGIRVCNNPNLIEQLSNIFDFGILVTSKNGLEPIYIDDFENENIQIGILSIDEVETITSQYGAGK